MKKHEKAAALALCFLFLTACADRTGAEPTEPQTVIAGLDEAPETDSTDWGDGTESALSSLDLSFDGAGAMPGISHPSTVYDAQTALGLLGLCTGHTAEKSAQLLEAAGFTVLAQCNFDKAADAPDHTCAYTLGVRQTEAGQKQYLIAVRGTNGGEWYSNFDFAPSQSGETAFAENFLFAAENVFAGVTGVIDFSEAPQILVCGHSRGAACANLLGVLLDEYYLSENIYTYTFATPMTVRPGYFNGEYDNIFNVINPGDVVPRLPLAGWGYARAGTDIVLNGAPDAVSRAERVEETLLGIAPDIVSYYTVRHSLTEAGESEDGITAFSMMETLSAAFSDAADLTASENRGTALRDGNTDFSGIIANESDFAPLRDLMSKAAVNGGAGLAEVLSEHLPAAYAKLLE